MSGKSLSVNDPCPWCMAEPGVYCDCDGPPDCDSCNRLLDEVVRLKTQLAAWHSVFGTTQLTHARARLEAAEEKAARHE